MPPILTVVGATGVQGGSVVDAALASGTYQIRAVTRDIQSDKAQALAAQGVQLVAADLNDEQSLVKAFDVSFFVLALQIRISMLMKSGFNRNLRCYGLLRALCGRGSRSRYGN